LPCEFLTSPLDEVGGELHAPAALPPGIYRTGGWLENGAHLNAIVTPPGIELCFSGRSVGRLVTSHHTTDRVAPGVDEI